jgi:uncharacterized small protein (DUF1192 family)
MSSKEGFGMKEKLIGKDCESLHSGIAEMEATIVQYREEIERLRKKRNVLLKINRMLKEELKDLIDVFSL